MKFSYFTKIVSGNTILFKNELPVEYIQKIKFFQDNSKGSFKKKEFRWSFNKNYWSSWEDLNQGNLAGIDIRDNRYFFLEVRYVQSAAGSGTVTTFYFEYDQVSGKTSSIDYTQTNPSYDYVAESKTVTNPLENSCNTSAEIDADTLCGKNCDYYLWRPNQKGTQTISTIQGLQQILNNLSAGIQDSINNGENVSGSGIGVFYQKSGRNLVFKRIDAGSGANISESNGVITLSVDASVISKDPSVNELYQLYNSLETNLYDISIYIDNKFIQVDNSINDLYLKDASSLKNLSNIGGGPGEIFKQITSNVAELRTIAAGNANVVVQTVGDQIRISLDASVSGAPVWADPDPVSATVGGITGGSDVSLGLNSIEILEKILYEYKQPNVILNLDPSPGYYEKWVYNFSTEPSIYGSFNNDPFKKVKITDASILVNGGGYSGMDSISYPSVESSTYEWKDKTSFISTWDDVTYTVQIFNEVNSTLMQTKEVSTGYNFVLPYIFGVIDNNVNVGNIDASILENFHANGNKIIVPKQSNEVEFTRPSGIVKAKFVYAYDASYGNLNSIFDVKNDFNVTTSFDSTIVNIDLGVVTNIPYKVYIKSHWIDVSTFKLIFNI